MYFEKDFSVKKLLEADLILRLTPAAFLSFIVSLLLGFFLQFWTFLKEGEKVAERDRGRVMRGERGREKNCNIKFFKDV